MCPIGNLSAKRCRQLDLTQISDSNVMHVLQLISIEHLEVAFLASKTPDDGPGGTTNLINSASMERIDDIIALRVLNCGIYMTGKWN